LASNNRTLTNTNPQHHNITLQTILHRLFLLLLLRLLRLFSSILTILQHLESDIVAIDSNMNSSEFRTPHFASEFGASGGANNSVLPALAFALGGGLLYLSYFKSSKRLASLPSAGDAIIEELKPSKVKNFLLQHTFCHRKLTHKKDTTSRALNQLQLCNDTPGQIPSLRTHNGYLPRLWRRICC
jgi:hypothetical protein